MYSSIQVIRPLRLAISITGGRCDQVHIITALIEHLLTRITQNLSAAQLPLLHLKPCPDWWTPGKVVLELWTPVAPSKTLLLKHVRTDASGMNVLTVTTASEGALYQLQ